MTPKDHEAAKYLEQKVPTPGEFAARQDIEEKKKREKLIDTWTTLFKTELEEKAKKKIFDPVVVKLHVVNRLTADERHILSQHFSKYGWEIHYAPEARTHYAMSSRTEHSFKEHYYMFTPIGTNIRKPSGVNF